MSRIAVTGASGFIGRYLCDELTAGGHDVIALGRGPDAAYRTDYSKDSLRPALDGVEMLVHLAGRRMTREDAPMDLGPFWSPNVGQIHDLVSAAQEAGAKRIVFSSTIAVYSQPCGLPYRETARAHPLNAYALSKLAAEHYLDLLTRSTDLSALSLRLAAVYGHGEKGTPALMHFVNLAAKGQELVVTGNRNYGIDQIYVRDAVGAVMAALSSDATGVVNIGGGRAIPVGEIAETVNDVFHNAGNLRYLNDEDAPMPKTYMAINEARDKLNWQPAFSLRDGLVDFRNTRAQAEQTKGST